jgi:hypothetical protein
MIVQIWFKQHAVRPEDAASGRFYVIEIPEPDFAGVCRAIEGPDLIKGKLIHSQAGERGQRIIIRREDTAFFGSSVDRLQEPHWQFIEKDA